MPIEKMGKLKALIFLLLLVNQNVSLASVGKIFILKTSGSCPDCSEKIAKMLASEGIASKIIGAQNLKSEVGLQDAIVVPGGDSEWDIKKDLLKAKSFTWLRDFIYNGGKYIGFCAGAYLTEKWILKGDKGLDVFPGQIKNYSQNKSSRAVNFKWGAQKPRAMFFQDGPAFFPKRGAKVEVLARFSESHVAAAVLFSFGKGRVGLISPHPEVDEDWYVEDNVKDADGIDYDLGLSFVKKALKVQD